ncbi:hypothetical protein ACFLX5_00030 [Chloroflexota bacterium]
MLEMQDYSGPFNPNISYDDFSKEALVKLVKEYSRSLMIVLGGFNKVLTDRYGSRAALECDIMHYLTDGPLISGWISRCMNITGGNVEAMFKSLQLDPAFPLGLFDVEWELVNPDHGFFIIKKCTALNQFEKQGQGTEIICCHEEESPTFLKTAMYHNPNVIVRPVKLPPRNSRDEIACKWEYKIERPTSDTDGKTGGQTEAVRPKEAADVSKGWSEEQIIEFWGYLPDHCKEVLRIIARKPDGCPKDDILNELGIPAEELSWRLGFIYLAIESGNFLVEQNPVRIIPMPWSYEMDKELALAIKEKLS